MQRHNLAKESEKYKQTRFLKLFQKFDEFKKQLNTVQLLSFDLEMSRKNYSILKINYSFKQCLHTEKHQRWY